MVKRASCVVALCIILLLFSAVAVGLGLGYFQDMLIIERSGQTQGIPPIPYPYKSYLGGFQWCNDYHDIKTTITVTDSDYKCAEIDQNCRYTDYSPSNIIPSRSATLPSCDQYNSFRGLLIICGGLAAIAFFLLLIGALVCPFSKVTRYLVISARPIHIIFNSAMYINLSIAQNIMIFSCLLHL